MKLRLNIATSPHENNRPFIAGTAFIGAVAFIALLILSRQALVTWRSNLQIRTDTARLEQRIQVDEAQHQALQAYFNTPQAQSIRDRADFLNSLISERSFPWTQIFMDLEKTLPPGVRVISISPKLVNGHAEVSMVIGASSNDREIEFLEAIEKSKNFSDVTVENERVSDQSGEPDPIRVSLNFWYAINA
jgi:Tfp pilus assembly protein PilN